MDRTYILPCQKSNFNSCEGCPEATCSVKHYSGIEIEVIPEHEVIHA